MYLNDNKDVITDLLLENFEIGTNSDYMKLSDIKNLLKSNGVMEKDIITIIKIVTNVFPDCEYVNNTKINNRNLYSRFKFLKSKV